MANNARRNHAKKKPASGLKSLISISALATTLVGWGVLGQQALQSGAPSQPADLGGIVQQILGDLPTLFQGSGSASTTRRATLRSVNLSTQSSSSRGFPITRTQSSR